ncbi:MAG: hypothetical protein PHU23_18560 [Dehalococcoidales bacterium]|nr:hypothetical protein [Dehalococcoidales bacterium]
MKESNWKWVTLLFAIGLILIPFGFVAWVALTYFVVTWGYWNAPAINEFWVDSWLPMILLMVVGPFICWVVLHAGILLRRRLKNESRLPSEG